MKRNLWINLIVCSCFALSITSCQGKVSSDQSAKLTDSLKVNNTFTEYTAVPCLANLLVSIVDSNRQFYKNEEFFYSLTFKLNNGNRRMTIEARLWDAPGKQQYKGVIKIGNALFLCSGDLEKESLFKAKSTSVIKTPLKEERLENESYPYAEEPILKGKFVDCENKPISTEIYTKGKIILQ